MMIKNFYIILFSFSLSPLLRPLRNIDYGSTYESTRELLCRNGAYKNTRVNLYRSSQVCLMGIQDTDTGKIWEYNHVDFGKSEITVFIMFHGCLYRLFICKR